ncbi:Vacuolar protein sorting-associated protein 8 [Tulasnella sp. 419]|nr:Vacuolar protein sorting-associated protein 8 [Tulasnella sp. 419]
MSTSPISNNGEAEWTAADESYSSQLQEVLNSDSDHSGEGEDERLDEDEEFLYTGVDSEPLQGGPGYSEQLADALGDGGEIDTAEYDDTGSGFLEVESASEPKPEVNLALAEASEDEAETSAKSNPTLPKSLSRSLLHPTVSRLRSFTPSRLPSSSSVNSAISPYPLRTSSPSPSHFSAISRAPSSTSDTPISGRFRPQDSEAARDAFRWTTLRVISNQVFSTPSQKASIVLGSSWGNPTVLAANGLICIGTDLGRVLVYDFSQQFKFICGSDLPGKPTGAVSALALSHDHSFLAVGYATGHINLFDLSHPQIPARSVPTTTLAAVTAGRKEGHLYGSHITALGFVGARHTAIVSADDNGLAFYHSLGKVLFVEANDVLRILGKYPDEEPVLPAKEATIPVKSPELLNTDLSSSGHTSKRSPVALGMDEERPILNQPITSSSKRPSQKRSGAAILAMAPLPLGTSPHPTDTYNLIALLTPIKLVVVGLKPSPRMWLRRMRNDQGGSAASDHESRGKNGEWQHPSKWKGCLAWYPSVTSSSSSFLDSSVNTTSSSLSSDHADTPHSERSKLDNPTKSSNVSKGTTSSSPSTPMLAYSWGSILKLVRVREEKRRQQVKDPKSVRQKKVIEVGHVVFEDVAQWETDKDVMAIQWLNVDQLLVLTTSTMDVYEVRSLSRVERVALDIRSLTGYPPSVPISATYDSISDCSFTQSMKVYKGKVFLLGQQDIRVGALLSWTDRILSFFQEGNFLGAIDLARSYYVGTAPGNKSNLPEDAAALKAVVGSKLRDLMTASASYAFSEDRMTDGVTHYTPDGRGVDRTGLFQGLVTTSVEASIALGSYDFLYEDLYDKYLTWGIEAVFLDQLEPFILDGSLKMVPTFITQRLIAKHEERGEYEKAERLIWHVDPANLDVNQAIKVCLKYELYDALIYLYTQTLGDYVSPLVELIGLVRKVQQARKEILLTSSPSSGAQQGLGSASVFDQSKMERLVPNAYKIYAYLGNVLSGLAYPSGQPLTSDCSSKAKRDVYQFLFYGRTSVWNGLIGRGYESGDSVKEPKEGGSGGGLVLTADEEGGIEPTYPYLRLLLRFDAESLLHALDIAFEDSFLNDVSQGISRQEIINILLQLVSSSLDTQRLTSSTFQGRTHATIGSTYNSTDFSMDDVIFINIFIARNVPKYPQFIQIAPNRLQDILLGLAMYGYERRSDSTDHTAVTTEDRQLAAEFLLSAYMPHDRDRLVLAFEQAGFYRILRTWYRHDHSWTSLISTYLRDPTLTSEELFDGIGNTLALGSQLAWVPAYRAGQELSTHSALPPDLLSTAVDSLPQLLEKDVTATACLVDTYFPGSHSKALTLIQSKNGDYRSFAYLRCLVEPNAAALNEDMDESVGEDTTKHQTGLITTDDALPNQRRRSPLVVSRLRSIHQPRSPSLKLEKSTRHLYVALKCRYEPHDVIKLIQTLPDGYVELESMVEITETAEVFDVVIWLLNRAGRSQAAFKKLEEVGYRHTVALMKSLADENANVEVAGLLDKQIALIRMGITLCREHSQSRDDGADPSRLPAPEEMWFRLLQCQVQMVQSLSSTLHPKGPSDTLDTLRGLIQETFTALVSQTTSKEVSLPRLFKRLVESTSATRSSAKGMYSEFRSILTGMLELYRSERDCLTLSNRLVERDLFDTMALGVKSRQRGWGPSSTACGLCGQPLFLDVMAPKPVSTDSPPAPFQISVFRSGVSYHVNCMDAPHPVDSN